MFIFVIVFYLVLTGRRKKRPAVSQQAFFYSGITIRRSDLQIETASAPPVIVVLSHVDAKMNNRNDKCK